MYTCRPSSTAEHSLCKRQVVGSSPTGGSEKRRIGQKLLQLNRRPLLQFIRDAPAGSDTFDPSGGAHCIEVMDEKRFLDHQVVGDLKGIFGAIREKVEDGKAVSVGNGAGKDAQFAGLIDEPLSYEHGIMIVSLRWRSGQTQQSVKLPADRSTQVRILASAPYPIKN